MFWYVHTKHTPTDRVFSRNLESEDFCEDMLCADGRTRNLWRCQFPKISEFVKNREELHLQFKIFVQEGIHGKIRLWPFAEFRKIGKRDKVLSKVA